MKTEFDKYDYVISIDLGTTFSGSCYSYVRDKEKIVHVVKWPEQTPNDTFEKTPTACLYNKEDPPQLIKWGKAAQDHIKTHPDDTSVQFISQFKLKLHDVFEKEQKQDLSMDFNDTQQQESNSISVKKATVDYLREIHKYTYAQLIQNRSSMNASTAASPEKIKYVLTIPATWMNKRDTTAMQDIAIEAGLINPKRDPSKKLMILSEAQAASLFCEREYCVKEDGKSRLYKGQRYLVCDAGGGTFDLATYECTTTTATGSDNKIEANFNDDDISANNGHCQLALESGGSCGSTILDQNMEKYLRDQIFIGCIEIKTLNNLVDQFVKEIKHYFGGDEADRNNYQMSADVHAISKITEQTSIIDSDSTNVFTTTSSSNMMDINENDYDYNQDYEDHTNISISNTDDIVTTSDDEVDMVDDDDVYDYNDGKMLGSEGEEDAERCSTLSESDYIYFTLPKKGIDSWVLENLALKGNIITANGDSIKQLRISHQDIAKYVFDPVVDQAIGLIRKQIKNSHTTIDTLFLLGGFGQSPYLYKKLHAEFITCTNAINHLIVPEYGYRASMRGGIYYGLDSMHVLSMNKLLKDVNGNFVKQPMFYELYKYLVGIDFNFIDLTAKYSIMNTNEFAKPVDRNVVDDAFTSIFTELGTFSDAIYRSFSFDSNRFVADYYNNHLTHYLNELNDSNNSSRSTMNDQFKRMYKHMIYAFISQLFEEIEQDFVLQLFPNDTWNPRRLRYCISFASSSAQPMLNAFKKPIEVKPKTSMDRLKDDLIANDQLLDHTQRNLALNFFYTSFARYLDEMSAMIACSANPGNTTLEAEDFIKIFLRDEIRRGAEQIGMLDNEANDSGERFMSVRRCPYGSFLTCQFRFGRERYYKRIRFIERLLLTTRAESKANKNDINYELCDSSTGFLFTASANFLMQQATRASGFTLSAPNFENNVVNIVRLSLKSDIYTFDLHSAANNVRTAMVFEMGIDTLEIQPPTTYQYELEFKILRSASPTWESMYYVNTQNHQLLSDFSSSSEEDGSTSTYPTVEVLFKLLSLETDFMTKEVRKYIKENINLCNPNETHAVGDLFINSATNQPVEMGFSILSRINKESLYRSILQFADTKVTTEMILKMLIVPWIQFRLAPAIMDVCKEHRDQTGRDPDMECCLMFSGEIVETKCSNGIVSKCCNEIVSYQPAQTTTSDNSSKKPVTAALFLFNVLKTELCKCFETVTRATWVDVPYCIYYEVDPNFRRHTDCLAYGVSSQTSQTKKNVSRVASQRYAVHFIKYRSEKDHLHITSQYQQKQQQEEAVSDIKEPQQKNDKNKADDGIVVDFQENSLVLHPLIEKDANLIYNVSISNINIHSESQHPVENVYIKKFYVKTPCSLAAVIYSSDDERDQEYTIANNCFKKVHRFIIPVKDVAKPIYIYKRTDRYSIIFTVKHDEYEQDICCDDFLFKINQ